MYRVKLYVHGLPQLFILDDFIPDCYTETELWVQLLIKAFAKHFGSYAKLVNNLSSVEALMYLTGCPCFQCDVRQIDKHSGVIGLVKDSHTYALVNAHQDTATIKTSTGNQTFDLSVFSALTVCLVHEWDEIRI